MECRDSTVVQYSLRSAAAMQLSLLVVSLSIFTIVECCTRRHSHSHHGHVTTSVHVQGTHWTATTQKTCPCVPLGECEAVVRIMERGGLDVRSATMRRTLRNAECTPSPLYHFPRIRCCLLEKSSTQSPPRRASSTIATSTTRGLDRNSSGRSNVSPSTSPRPDEFPECGVCGQIPLDQRIVGGSEATIGQFPWIARLGYTQGSRSEEENPDLSIFQCGASLVTKWHLITAAHCVLRMSTSPQLRWVRLGEHDERTKRDCDEVTNKCAPPTQDIRIAEWSVHPKYRINGGFSNDIAVLRLEKPVDFTEYVKPICLPQENERGNITNRRVIVAGWGATKPGKLWSAKGSPVLLELWKSVISPEECASVYRNITDILPGQLCAGGTSGEDSCTGDSGGPLAIPLSATGVDDSGQMRFSLLGVVSFGARLCGSKGMPGVYTDIVYYREWLKETLRKLSPAVSRMSGSESLSREVDKMSPKQKETRDKVFDYDTVGNPIWRN